jgi:SAM-dependent methyltransferase
MIETYRKKAERYDITCRFYPAPGYPQRAHRLRAVEALGLRPGDRVIDIACGTGLNFPLIEEAIGPDGRIVGVDLTDAMLAQAQHRIEANGWRNVGLVQADAAEFDFPTRRWPISPGPSWSSGPCSSLPGPRPPSSRNDPGSCGCPRANFLRRRIWAPPGAAGAVFGGGVQRA